MKKIFKNFLRELPLLFVSAVMVYLARQDVSKVISNVFIWIGLFNIVITGASYIKKIIEEITKE